MVMGNYGVLVIGQSIIRRLTRLFYFERAAQTYILALQTGQPLRLVPDKIAGQIAGDLDDYPGQAERHFTALKTMLDAEGADYAQ